MLFPLLLYVVIDDFYGLCAVVWWSNFVVWLHVFLYNYWLLLYVLRDFDVDWDSCWSVFMFVLLRILMYWISMCIVIVWGMVLAIVIK